MEKAALPIIKLPEGTFVLGIRVKIQNQTSSIEAFYLEDVRQLLLSARGYAESDLE